MHESSKHLLPWPWALVCSVAIILHTAAAAAQPAGGPAGLLTLADALTIAEANSESIAAAEAGVQRAEGEQSRARSGRWPQLSASASYDRALASEFSGVFDRSNLPPCDPFMLDPSAPLEARVAEIERAIDCGAIGRSLFGGGAAGGDDGAVELPFGRENTWRYGLTFSQVVYSGGRIGALEGFAAAGRRIAGLTLQSRRAQLLFDVTQAYYDAALSERLVAIAEATLNQADATLRQVQAGFEAGAQPEFELLRARVARDNDRPALIRQRANRDIALLRLKQLLELPADYDLQLADTLADDQLSPPPAFAERLAVLNAIGMPDAPPVSRTDLTPLMDRSVVREAAAALEARQASVDAARAERLPNVSLTSSFSRVAYPSVFFPTGDFRTNWSVGALLQVPVLTGGRLQAEQRIAEADLAESRAQLEQVQELAALDTRSAWAELVAAQAAWEASSGTVEQALRAYGIAEVRYSAGVSTQLELSDARLLLQQSEANRAQAARDLQIARARIALLPDLPLLTPAAGRATTPASPPTAPRVPAPQPGTGGLRNATQTVPGQSGGRQ